MARRFLPRRTVATSLAVALLAASMAGSAVALDGGLVEDTTDAVDDTVNDAVDAASGGDGEASSSGGLTDTVDQTVDGVREVVEKAASGDVGGAVDATVDTAAGAADAATETVGDAAGAVGGATDTVGQTVDDVTGAVDDVTGGVQPGGDAPVEVPGEGEAAEDVPHRVASAPRMEPDGMFRDRSASTSTGFSRNIGGSAVSPSTFEPPTTSGALDERPEAVDDVTEAPEVAALSPGPGAGGGVPDPRDIPSSLVLTATALLVLAGTGHVIHAVRRADLF